MVPPFFIFTNMNKFLYLVFLALTVCACSGDDDDNGNSKNTEEVIINPDEAIIGKWNLTTCEHGSSETYQEPGNGTFIVRADGTFSMTGDLLGEGVLSNGIVINCGDRTEIHGTYSFQNRNNLSFHVDEAEFPKVYCTKTYRTTFDDNGRTMKLYRTWLSGTLFESWYFKKGI